MAADGSAGGIYQSVFMMGSSEQKVIGFACGVFDLFHAGHVLMFRECREHCDHLVVAVNKCTSFSPVINPGKQAPVYSVDDRKLLVESCRYVDEVLLYEGEDELLEILKTRKFDIRFLGDDYRGKPVTGDGLVPIVHFTDRSHGKSTSAIKEKIRKSDR